MQKLLANLAFYGLPMASWPNHNYAYIPKLHKLQKKKKDFENILQVASTTWNLLSENLKIRKNSYREVKKHRAFSPLLWHLSCNFERTIKPFVPIWSASPHIVLDTLVDIILTVWLYHKKHGVLILGLEICEVINVLCDHDIFFSGGGNVVVVESIELCFCFRFCSLQFGQINWMEKPRFWCSAADNLTEKKSKIRWSSDPFRVLLLGIKTTILSNLFKRYIAYVSSKTFYFKVTRTELSRSKTPFSSNLHNTINFRGGIQDIGESHFHWLRGKVQMV